MPQLDLGQVVGPQGPQGLQGPAGPQGMTGPAGPGVPSGGAADEVLVKQSGTDYNAAWESLGNQPAITGLSEKIAKTQDSLVYVVDGNKCANTVPAGAYFQLINSTIVGRSDGSYTASKAIPANTAIDATYFSQSAPLSGGALNAAFNFLSSNLVYLDGSADAITDANDILKTGIYKAINSTAHTPSANHYTIYHVEYTNEEKTQLAIATNSGNVFSRVYYADSWSAWVEVSNNNILDRLSVFAIYSGSFVAQNPGKIEDVITSLPSGTGKYIILTYYGGYSFANSASLYFIQRGDTWYGLQEIVKGSESRTVTISTDGTVAKGESNAYAAKIIAFRVAA